MPTVRGNPAAILAELQARGLAVAVTAGPAVDGADDDGPRPRRQRLPPALVAPAFTPARVGGVWVVPVETAAAANGRDWRERGRLTVAARRAVCRALGPHLAAVARVAERYHAGGAVALVLVRLGGRELDPANLPNALKPVEDAVALVLGDVPDRGPRWRVGWGQEPGGPLGVRLTLAAAGRSAALPS